ncbi:MAG: type II toxin-antitoxin system VapC family toxin [Proteobacteria bacterium]|nr:type II toxin-antitoxin system VapC family toxin [Pseudomonadota bacterium]
MKLLLDTHIFLWYISGDYHLPKSLKDIIQDSVNEVYLSVVSLWESIVKYHLGKLPLPLSPEKYLPLQRERHDISSLSLDEVSIIHLSALPSFHSDPFDRMLICQAIEHNMTIVTMDAAIAQYPIKILPKP